MAQRSGVVAFLSFLLAISGIEAGIARSHEAPGQPGSLIVRLDDGSAREMPLQRTEVRVEISGFVARTVVEQTFANPFSHPIEAIYAFPLGDEAAVDEFELRSGLRVIRGEIRRREEARRIYDAARDEGRQAALLEQERPNVFIQSVANLMPGEDVSVRLRTVELLDYHEGVYEYLFPTVIGERYDASPRLAAASAYRMRRDDTLADSGQAMRSGLDLAIHVEIDAGVPIHSIHSPTQTVYVTERDATRASIELGAAETIPNADFILRWNVSSPVPAVGLLAHRAAGSGYFALLLQPLGKIAAEQAAPKEVVFVLDTSGSMSGDPVETAKQFVTDALRSLQPQDRFNLIRFSGGSSSFAGRSMPNERVYVDAALEWTRGLAGGGGTELMKGLRHATRGEPVDGMHRQIVFLTDGFIGHEGPILEAIARLPDSLRIFTVGIGAHVNHYLLDRMARQGHGAYTSIPSAAGRHRALERLGDWITRPYLTDIEIDWGGLPVGDFAPRQPRDLFNGQNLYLVGRYFGSGSGALKVRGYLGGRPWETTLEVRLPEYEPSHAALASIWARHRIEELLSGETELAVEEVRDSVTALALEHSLMSPFTSFVAVDESAPVNPHGLCEPVVQELPAEALSSVEPSAASPVATWSSSTHSTGLRERVTVAARPSVVDLSANASSVRFSGEFITDLPVPGRFYQNVIALAPGVQDADGNGNPNVHGSRSRDFKAIVGGISNVDPLTGQQMSQVNPNSIEEMQVISAGAGVEYARAQGGFARVIQKQGSNDHEGQVELLYRSHRLDGDPPGHGAYDVNVGLSGPIVRDRLWYRASHSFSNHANPIDTTRGMAIAGLESISHDDRLTWQISPRHKLALDLRESRRDADGVGLGSWRGPDAALSETFDSANRVLTWTVPFSPMILIESRLSTQRAEFASGPAVAAASNGCTEATDAWSSAHCSDWVEHRQSGRFYRTLDDVHERDTLRVDITAFGGRHFGATHQLRIGLAVDREEYARRLTRGPLLFRVVDPGGSGETLFARVAPDPSTAGRATGASWGLWIEDELKPSDGLILTLGLRHDAIRLDAPGFEAVVPGVTAPGIRLARPLGLRDAYFSPMFGIAWDPWDDGKTKLFATVSRRRAELHPALALIESEPATVDVQLTAPDAGPLNVQQLDRDLAAPRQTEWTLGVEREIATETRITFRIVRRDFRNQLGWTDLNHEAGAAPGDWLVHDPGWGEVLHIGNLNDASEQSYTLDVVRRLYRSWEFQGGYTWSRAHGDAEWFDLALGDERSRIEDGPGLASTDLRQQATAQGVWNSPYGFAFGGRLRWQSGLPYSTLVSGLLLPVSADQDWQGVPVPRLFLDDERRNTERNASIWTLDLKLTRLWNAGRGGNVKFSIEVFNLLDDRTLTVYDARVERGSRIDGVADATRRYGRWYQLGATLQF